MTAMATEDDVARARTLLKDLRGSIDRIDAAIVYMLAERFRCTEAVSHLKARAQSAAGGSRPRAGADRAPAQAGR